MCGATSSVIDPVELYQAAKPGPGDTENQFSQAQGSSFFDRLMQFFNTLSRPNKKVA